MITQKTTQDATYTLKTAGTLTARYHDGQTRRAVQVMVTRDDTGARYTVLVPTDGKTLPTCDCPHAQRRLKGTNECCKHVSFALGHLLREATPAAVSPGILSQLGTTAEEEAKAEAERARQERLREEQTREEEPTSEGESFAEAREMLAAYGIDTRPQDPRTRDWSVLWDDHPERR